MPQISAAIGIGDGDVHQAQLEGFGGDFCRVQTIPVVVLGGGNHFVGDKLAGHRLEHLLFFGEGKGDHGGPFWQGERERQTALRIPVTL